MSLSVLVDSTTQGLSPPGYSKRHSTLFVWFPNYVLSGLFYCKIVNHGTFVFEIKIFTIVVFDNPVSS